MGIKIEKFIENRNKYGLCSSWAVWSNDKISDTNGKYYDKIVEHLRNIGNNDKKLLDKYELNPNVILIALNFSSDVEDIPENIFRNFHSKTKKSAKSKDDRLMDACYKHKIMKGAYITDIIKWKNENDTRALGYPDPISDNLISSIGEGKIEKQVEKLIEEINGIIDKNRELLIVAMHKYAKEILIHSKEKIINGIEIADKNKILFYSIPHFSAQLSNKCYFCKVDSGIKSISIFSKMQLKGKKRSWKQVTI